MQQTTISKTLPPSKFTLHAQIHYACHSKVAPEYGKRMMRQTLSCCSRQRADLQPVVECVAEGDEARAQQDDVLP